MPYPFINEDQAKQLVTAIESGQLPESAQAQAAQLLTNYKWAQQNIDLDVPKPKHDPEPAPVDMTPERAWMRPDKVDPVMPESPEGQRISEAEMGIDNSVGMPFGIRAKLAAGLDHPEVQRRIMQKAAGDYGIPTDDELPPGVPRVFESPVTGEKVFLRRDSETGKYRMTKLDALGPELADLADMMDPDQILSIVGGVGGAVVGAQAGRPLVGEAAGEASGRSIGVLLETIASSVAGAKPSVEEVKEVLWGTMGEGAAAVLLSRGMEKGVNMGRRIWNAAQGKGISEQAFEMSKDEVADALRATAADVEKITEAGGRIELTVGEATGDVARLSEETSRANVATSSVRRRNEIRQRENIKSLENFIDDSSAGANYYNADEVVDLYKAAANEYNSAVSDAYQELGQVVVRQDGVQVGDVVIPQRWYEAPGVTERGDGIRVAVVEDPTYGKLFQVNRANLSGRAKGTGGVFYRTMFDDAFRHGAVPASDNKISIDALRAWDSLEREGHQFIIGGNRDVTIRELVNLKTGDLTPKGKELLEGSTEGIVVEGAEETPKQFWLKNDPEDPILVWKSGPAQTEQNYLNTLTDEFDEIQFEQAIGGFEATLVAKQANYENEVLELDRLLGWNPQTQASRYKINNNLSRSRLGKSVSQLEAISQRAIGRGDALEADRLLADLFRADGDGLVASLADPWLDARQALFTRDRLRAIAAKPGGSPLAGQLASDIDSLLKNAKWSARDNAKLDVSDARAAFVEQDRRVIRARQVADRAGSILTSNAFLKEGFDGEYTNATLGQLGKLLRNGNQGVSSMRVAVEDNPETKHQFQRGLVALWKKSAFKDGHFNFRGHEAFMDNYSDALSLAVGADTLAQLRRAPQRLRQEVSKSGERLEKLRKLVLGEKKDKVKSALVNPNALSYTGIWRSLRKMGPAQRAQTVRLIREEYGNEGLEKLNATAIREINTQAKKWVASGDYRRMDDWINLQEKVLKDQFGAGYVENLRVVQRTLRRMVDGITAVAPDSQPLWLRVTRSAFGPLSKKQRIATAATYTTHRLLANNILQTISDPAKMREFRRYNAKNGTLTKMVVAGMSRLGIFDGLSLPEDVNERLSYVQGLFNDMAMELPEGQGYNRPLAAGPDAPQEQQQPAMVTAPPPPQLGPVPAPVHPGRGLVEDRRRAAIAASEADLRDFGSD